MGKKSAKQWEKRQSKREKSKPSVIVTATIEEYWDDEDWSPPVIPEAEQYQHFVWNDGYETDDDENIKPLHNLTPHHVKVYQPAPKMPSLFECCLIILKQKFSYNICNFILKDVNLNQYIKNETIQKWHCRRATENDGYRGWVTVKPAECMTKYITVK
jgi:hypothetical protein